MAVVSTNSTTTFSPTELHFFQPCIRIDFNLRMKIPPTFFKLYFNSNPIHESYFLKSNLCEKLWSVKIEGHEITEGWEEFALAHGIQLGDFVVFRHEASMIFHVSVCDNSMCERDYPPYQENVLMNSGASDKRVLENTIGEASNILVNPSTFDQPNQNTFFRANLTPFLQEKCAVCIPAGFARYNDLSKDGTIIIIDSQERRFSVTLTLDSNGQFFLSKGLLEMLGDNDIKEDDSFGFKIVRKEEEPIWKLVSRAELERLESQLGRYLVVKLHPHHFKERTLGLKRSFVSQNELRHRIGKAKIMDIDGETWSGKIKQTKDGRFYIKGWMEVCYKHKIKIGDILKVELIDNGKKATTFKLSRYSQG